MMTLRIRDVRSSLSLRVILCGLTLSLSFLQFIWRTCYAQCEVAPTNRVLKITFLDETHGWIVYNLGNKEYLARTGDGGTTWTSALVVTPIVQLYFLTPQHGWAVAAAGRESTSYTFSVLSTHDGGVTWTSLSARGFPEKRSMDVKGILFVDHKHGWIVGSKDSGSSFGYQTSDGGQTFNEVGALSDYDNIARGIASDGDHRVWIYGNNSLLCSTNQGVSWTRQLQRGKLPGGHQIPIMSGSFRSNGQGVLGGEGAGGILLRTGDRGSHWHVVLETKQAVNFRSVSFWDDRHGCAVGSSNSIFCTTDGGRSWSGRNVLPHPTAASPACKAGEVNLFTSLLMTEAGRGWLLDSDGLLYITSNGGDSWHEIDPATTFAMR